jgi:hypothetical protein
MANRRTISPELAAVVARARLAAQAAGELRSIPRGSPGAGLASDARMTLADWLSSGDYDRAVAKIVADDPELASQ